MLSFKAAELYEEVAFSEAACAIFDVARICRVILNRRGFTARFASTSI